MYTSHPCHVIVSCRHSAWGRPVEAVLSKISDEPVAAASLGQVYRGRLAGLGGSEVAIKVLRPRVLATVALDLYLMRAAALALQRLPSVSAHAPPPPPPLSFVGACSE